ncbi:hypothetical protein SARC_04907 [Sphaeroforma arctica JP610]|uniref:Uncharacterized protein n=1 Tax=Sphaeroforma arctica JP610 TaxID=667725 RepID=A0A0L0G1V8_9EUKA|nr:hypothetical protein SARC_04907 [Sphaeroforma arctica JP610]KNC82824.1 hypothetical protein SARC_04907 [Sphaeroforma arctica JP610]|eukprot:XP_014156726.1 hypothetical protein SARC_04907 [Sphaeroforma arctica JP610]
MRQSLVQLANRYTGHQVRNIRKQRAEHVAAVLRRKNNKAPAPVSKHFTIDQYAEDLRKAMAEDQRMLRTKRQTATKTK